MKGSQPWCGNAHLGLRSRFPRKFLGHPVIGMVSPRQAGRGVLKRAGPHLSYIVSRTGDQRPAISWSAIEKPRRIRFETLQPVHRPQYPPPHRVAVQVALIEQGIGPHGGMDRRVPAVLLHPDLGRPVDVEVRHTPIHNVATDGPIPVILVPVLLNQDNSVLSAISYL